MEKKIEKFDKPNKYLGWAIYGFLGLILASLVVIIVYATINLLNNESFNYDSLSLFRNSGYTAPGPAFFKRPFVRRPLYFRPSLHPLIRQKSPKSRLPTGHCKYIKKLDHGTLRIPDHDINNILLLRSQLDTLKSNSWTISFWAKFDTDNITNNFTFLKKGTGAMSSPMMAYMPYQKILACSIDTVFDQLTTHPISLKGFHLNQYNHYVWVQRGGRMTVYVNGQKVEDKILEAAPSPVIVSRGPLYIRSDNLIHYHDILVCDRPWNYDTLKLVMDQQSN